MAKITNVHTSPIQSNFVINGNFDFWQRVASATTTVNTATTASGYTADRVQYLSAGTTVKNYSIVRSTDVPTQAQSGLTSPYSYLFTALTGIGSFASSDLVQPFRYQIEGTDYEALHSKTVTTQFWFKASTTGTYSISFTNATNDRCFVTTFTVNAANTWEFKSVTITLDNTGTWAFDSGNRGILISIGQLSGTSLQTSTLGSWQSGNLLVANTATNWFTTNATIRVAQFAVFLGQSTGATGFMRSAANFAEELVKCQRYYEKTYDYDVAPGTNTSSGMMYSPTVAAGVLNGSYIGPTIPFKVIKRTAPATVQEYSKTGTLNAGSDGNSADLASHSADAQSNGTVGISFRNNSGGTLTPAGTVILVHWIADAEF